MRVLLVVCITTFPKETTKGLMKILDARGSRTKIFMPFCRETLLYRAIDTLVICRSGDCAASRLPVKGSNGMRVCAVEMTSRV